MRLHLYLWMAGYLVACSAGAPPAAAPAPVQARAPAESLQQAPPPGTLYREDVVKVVEAGLGSFLQRVEVAPSLEDGAFRGFRVVTLTPPEFWRGVDLEPGDVVLSVNGLPIERETQAYEAFQSLRSAEELVVSYLRAGEKRELRYKIVPRPVRERSLEALAVRHLKG